MKKIALISALVMTLLACSISDVSSILTPLAKPTPLPIATNTVYVAPSDTPTITATLPTPTFTGTPTLVGGGFTATPTLTSTNLTETPAVTGSPMDTTSTSIIGGLSLVTPLGVGFTSVKISGNILKWGGCEPSSITFTARVADPINEVAVLWFYRLKSPTTGDMSKWEGGGIMNGDETGTFTYTVTVKNITNYRDYPDAWLQYQLVALDVHFNHVGYTQPYLSSITIAACG
ncbi:MAG: hypothetical protein WBW94_04120 [Anaerolineales bacterium]